jgi:hypothetical protein
MERKSSRRGTDFNAPTGPPFSGSGGFTQTPLATISNSFKEAIDWIKSEPEDDTFSHIGLIGLVTAAEAAQKGEIEKAIAALRKAKSAVESARRKSFVSFVKFLLHPRKKATFLESLLASLLNVRGVKVANKAIKKFEENNSTENVFARLKAMVDTSPSLDDFITQFPFLKQKDLHSLSASDPHLRSILDQYAKFGDLAKQPHHGYCEVCHKHAAGEMRQADGHSWKLCHFCIQNAQKLIANQKKHVSDLIDSLRDSQKNFEESLTVDPRNEQSKTNVDTSRKILKQLNSQAR